MADHESELLTLLKARCPVIYIVSPDEERVERILTRLADELPVRISYWSLTQGFTDRQGDGSTVASPDSKEPMGVLRILADHHHAFRLADLVVANPPRGGLGPTVCDQLNRLQAT